MRDTDDELRGADAADKVRSAFVNAPPMRTAEERAALDAWVGLLDAPNAITPTAATIQYERSLIGHVLAEAPRSMLSAGDLISPEHFAQAELGEVFRVMHDLWNAGRPFDPTTICEQLHTGSKLDAPWSDVIATCNRVHTTASTVADKAASVYGAWRNRRLAALGAALYHRARGAAAHDAGEILDEVTSKLVELEAPADRRIRDVGIGDAAQSVVRDIHARSEAGNVLPGVSTGLSRLNYYSGGFEPGKVIVIKADTGVGKTAFAGTLAINVARASARATDEAARHQVAYISLEMEATQVALRALANVGSVDGMNMRLASMSRDEINRMLLAEKELRVMNNWLRVLHSPGMSLSGIRRYLQRLALQFGRGPSVVFIDYVQLLRAAGERTREQEIATLSTGLKNMASDLSCTMVLLSQVNADGAARESRRIEHDADMVMHLMPEDASADPVDLQYVYDLVIGKNRSGVTAPRGKYKVLFLKRFQRIVERAETEETAGWWGKRPGAGHD